MSNLYNEIRATLQSLVKEEQGQDMVEYTILTGMIVVAIIASIGSVSAWVTSKWTTLSGALT